MKPTGGNADFRAEAELTAVGKLGGGIVHDDGAIDLVEKPRCSVRILGNDTVGMPRSVSSDGAMASSSVSTVAMETIASRYSVSQS